MISSTFLFAGKSEFIVKNNKGESYIFSIKRGKARSKFESAEHMYYVKCCRDGNSGEYNGRYMGYFNTRSTTNQGFRAGHKGLDEHTKAFKVLKWAVSQVVNEKELPEGYSIEHTGKCGACGKRLTDDWSKEIGLGPTCLKNVNLTTEQKLKINFRKILG
jgi:hypothetical protein